MKKRRFSFHHYPSCFSDLTLFLLSAKPLLFSDIHGSLDESTQISENKKIAPNVKFGAIFPKKCPALLKFVFYGISVKSDKLVGRRSVFRRVINIHIITP